MTDDATTVVGGTADSDYEPLPPPPLARGAIIGDRYTLVAPLGKGGMGDVHRVRHRTLDKDFALKMISASFADNARARAMFLREAKLASALVHPNIVSIVDFGEDLAHGAYMVMELIEGVSLTERMAGRPLPVRLACDLISQITDAVRHIHEHQVIHGDIKDDNILLAVGAGDRRARAVLLDFGLARPRHGARSSGIVDGTPDFMAPERIQGGPPSLATDIYSLGVLLFVMLTGRPPFTGSLDEVLRAHIAVPPPSPSATRGEPLDERLDALVVRALDKDPAQRHGDAGRLLYEIRTVMEMLGMATRGGRPRVHAAAAPRLDRAVAAERAFDVAPCPLAVVGPELDLMAVNALFATRFGRTAGSSLEGRSVAELDPALRQVVIAVATGDAAERTAEIDDADGGRWRVQVVRGPDHGWPVVLVGLPRGAEP